MRPTPTIEQRVNTLRASVLGMVQHLDRWTFDGEHSRTDLHMMGSELASFRAELTGIRRLAQFPSFADPPEGGLRYMILRRRKLIRMVYGLPPANIEILDWLGGGDDKEAAYLYAFARGSVSERSEPLRLEFYQHVDDLMASDPLLDQVRNMEIQIRDLGILYAGCQARGYEALD